MEPSLYHNLENNPKLGRNFEWEAEKYIWDAIEEVRYEDKTKDHSFESLTEEEKLEIEVFKQIKQDPYFKHYIENAVWDTVDWRNEIKTNMMWMFNG